MSKPIPYEIIPRTELAVYKIYGVREHSSQIPKYKCFNKVDISNNIFLIFAKKKTVHGFCHESLSFIMFIMMQNHFSVNGFSTRSDHIHE